MNGFDGYTLGASNNNYANGQQQQQQQPNTAPLKLRPSNRGGPRPQQQFSNDGLPSAASNRRDYAPPSQEQPRRPVRSQERPYSPTLVHDDFSGQSKPPRPNQPSARLQQAIARPTSGISIASTVPSEDDRESYRRDFQPPSPRLNGRGSRDPSATEEDFHPPPVPVVPTQPEPPKAMNAVLSAFSDAGQRGRNKSDTSTAPPSRSRRGGESAQGESSRIKSLNKKYPSTPAFKEIEKVLDRIAAEWPELLPDHEHGTEFDPVSLALSMLDPDGDDASGKLASFVRLEKDLGRALKGHIQSHYRAFDASVSAYNGTLANLGSASKQVGSLRSRLAEVKDVLGTRRSELGVITTRKNELAEMERILDTIDRLKDVPDQLESLISEKRFLSAVVLLVRSLKTINRPEMMDIGAVSDLRSYLQNQETALLEILVEEVNNHLYLKSFYCDTRWKSYTRGQDSLPVIEPHNKVDDVDLTQSPSLSSSAGKVNTSSMLSRYLTNLSMRPSTDPLLSEPHTSDPASTAAIAEPSSPTVDTSRPPPSPLLPHSLDDLSAPTTSTSRPNPEANSFTYIESLIESLACLGKLTYAIELIVQRLPHEIYNLVEETIDEVSERHEAIQRPAATSMARNTLKHDSLASVMSLTAATASNLPSASGFRPSTSQQHAHLASAETLRDLFWTLFSKLDAVLQGFRVSFEVSMRISERRGFSDKRRRSNGETDTSNLLFSLVEVWKPIQKEVRGLLHEYLTEASGSSVAARNMVTSVNEVLRTGRARDLNKAVFRFVESDTKMASKVLKHHEDELTRALKTSVPGLVSSAVEMSNTVMATSSAEDRVTGPNEQARGFHRLLVPPDAFNVSVMFAPTLAFLDRMKEVLPRAGLGADEDRGFGSVLEDFVLNTYLPQLEEKVTNLFQNAMSASDSFLEDSSYRRFSSVPLFKGATNVLVLIDSLYSMLRSTPFHRESYSKLIMSVIAHFYSKCAERYHELVSKDAEAGNKDNAPTSGGNVSIERLSATWARDPTMLKCWAKIQEQIPSDDPTQPSEVLYEELRNTLHLKSAHTKLAPDQLLTSKKHVGLGYLATGLCWFADRIASLRDDTKQTVALLPSSSSDNQLNKYLDGTDDSVTLPLTSEMASQFETLVGSIRQLANSALLTIRTDLRLQCLHYLDNMTANRVYELETSAIDPDRFILDLNTSLASCDGALATVLSPAQRHLVLIGLPTLIDQVLISNAKRMRSSTAEGGGRICRGIVAVQQNLKNLGDSTHALHVELDRSRKYYDLLRQNSPEAVMDCARNKPCAFDFDEARVLLALICRVNREGSQAIDNSISPEERKRYNDLAIELMRYLKEDQ